MIEKRNIFLIGPMGSGKSTIGRRIANHLNMVFFDSDQELEKRTGADIDWVFELEGEKGFRKREKKIIYEIIKKQGIILATGGGSIKLKETRAELSKRGIVIYLKTSIEKQIIRTQYDKKRPLLKKNKSIKEILKKLSEERNHLYQEIADFTINTDNQNPKIITNKIITLIKNM